MTPNIPEARVLTGLGESKPPGRSGPSGGANSVPTVVVVTGGHSEGLVDLFYDGDELRSRSTGARSSEAARPTVPDAPTRRRWPRSWPSAWTRSTRPVQPGRWPPKRSATASTRSAKVPGRWTCSARPAELAPLSTKLVSMSTNGSSNYFCCRVRARPPSSTVPTAPLPGPT